MFFKRLFCRRNDAFCLVFNLYGFTAFLIFFRMGFGFLMEYLDPSFRTPEEVKEYLEIPLLATLPKNNGKVNGKAHTAFLYQSQGEPPR